MKLLLAWLLASSAILLNIYTVFAAEAITITSTTTSITARDEFSISVTANGLEPTAKYYLKAIGGDENYDVQTKATGGSWLNWNSSWSEFPQIDSTADGGLSSTVTARFRDETTSGSKNVRVRVRKVDDDENIDSNDIQISVTALPPKTPSPTPSPSTSPSPTIKPSSTPTPKPATPKPTTKPTESPDSTSTPEVLALTDNPTPVSLSTSPSPSSEPASGSENKSIVAIGLAVAGIVFIGLAAAPFLKSKLNRV